MNKEDIRTMLLICLFNIIKLVCFIILAVIFKKWWLVLFVALFWTTFKNEENGDNNE